MKKLKHNKSKFKKGKITEYISLGTMGSSMVDVK